MGSRVYFKLESEFKWRDVEIHSTFITVGELRALICESIGLDNKTQTVQLRADTVEREPYTDAKQVPRGSRVRAKRLPVEQLEQVLAQAAGGAGDKKDAADEADPATEQQATASIDEEFGPDVFDKQAQRRYQAKQAAEAAAVQQAAKEKQQKSAAPDAAHSMPEAAALHLTDDATKGVHRQYLAQHGCSRAAGASMQHANGAARSITLPHTC